jgi:hypothetical protein
VYKLLYYSSSDADIFTLIGVHYSLLLNIACLLHTLIPLLHVMDRHESAVTYDMICVNIFGKY